MENYFLTFFPSRRLNSLSGFLEPTFSISGQKIGKKSSTNICFVKKVLSIDPVCLLEAHRFGNKKSQAEHGRKKRKRKGRRNENPERKKNLDRQIEA